MAEEMKGTNISSPVVPFTKEDRYATHDETFGRGGYRSIASVSEMNAIPTERRKEGMLVNVVGDKIYRLVNGSFVSAFKTINGQSILGSGNVPISGGSGSDTHDLTIDVKTGYDASGTPKIYFRIREIVPNGRIHFVRKKRIRYYPANGGTYIKRYGYAVMHLHATSDGGMDVSHLSPNTWYEYAISEDDLIGAYPPGSTIPGGSNKRKNGVIRFKGNTYAKAFDFKNAPFTKKLTVLHAGLQYNVLSGTTSPLFKYRGEAVPIDVRLRILDPADYYAGYEYNYAVR